MRLNTIVHLAKTTELKQIIVGEDDEQILSLLNLALIEVYAKFAILQEEHTINIEEGRTRYRLPPNVQKVLQAYVRNIIKDPLNGEDGFEEIPLNDINSDKSIFTPQPYLLHIPNPDLGKIYSIMTIVAPPCITKENIDTIEFFVPEQYVDPILHYMAYRAYKSMNGDQQTEIGTHLQAYMSACDEVYRKGLAHTPMMTNIKLTDRGWV